MQEGFSQDPHLTKMMGAAHLRGLQGGECVMCMRCVLCAYACAIYMWCICVFFCVCLRERVMCDVCMDMWTRNQPITCTGAMGGPETYLTNQSHALVATVKHYAAYGMSAGGIDGSPADLSEQKLREVYLKVLCWP